MQELKNILMPFARPFLQEMKIRQFKSDVKQRKKSNQPLKVVIGSENIFDDGWLPTDIYIIDLLEERTWKKFFDENDIDLLLAEHVWEHLTLEQGKIAAKNCYKFLKKGGNIRLAVPDGYHQDEDYIDYVKPGGHGIGSDDHKVLYNYKLFQSIFEEAGFQVKLLEYFDEEKEFQCCDWDTQFGTINRSIRFDKRNVNNEPKYTSIIIDAVK
ncbi:class I SAM-dependent methyltransferase [Flammeovirga sp. MY04]|uniref:class I SAM-dependent methyltransferase n=1 Tax=Flammeovirga sp. MY04 TaxID=1191459 RepID=UPI000B08D1ED|nr:hypothetical protein [Flammeovirga sp. MY04]